MCATCEANVHVCRLDAKNAAEEMSVQDVSPTPNVGVAVLDKGRVSSFPTAPGKNPPIMARRKASTSM